MIAGNAADAYAAMNTLIAVFMIPTTLFLSTVLVKSANSRWAQLARDTAVNMLFYASLAVATFAWFLLPTFLHRSTPVPGLMLSLGISLASSVFCQLAKSKTGLQRAQAEIRSELTPLQDTETELRAAASPYLDNAGERAKAKLSDAGRKRIRRRWLVLSLALIVVLSAWSTASAFALSVSFSLKATLVILTLMAFEVGLAGIVAHDCLAPRPTPAKVRTRSLINGAGGGFGAGCLARRSALRGPLEIGLVLWVWGLGAGGWGCRWC
ncbi:MAG: hypothetical protein LBI33_04250, partial [Propionibacteriaceae bacterium]|nr:hypothetical protein [Propionibacteriaceae bacterium]